MSRAKAIIFDWGRTLYDKENGRLFPETKEVVESCAKKYELAIVSLSVDGDIEDRFEKLKNYDLRKSFRFALFHPSDKDTLFRNAIGNLDLEAREVMIVDDRIKRLRWGIENGCQTIWIRKGKYAGELPNGEGNPTYTVDSLREILRIV
ncbi:MAG: HAD family hydrolase [Candidatus Micrarchaeota archaeon]|nr:HAD family hydrolase [Candidatus Micrarchaeota archaeon]